MDKFSVLFVLVNLLWKLFTRYYLQSKGIKWTLPHWLGYMSRADGWFIRRGYRLLLVTVLVALCSCAEIVRDPSPKDEGVLTHLRELDIYRSVVYSVFVLVGVQYRTPLLMAPWLNFTLMNMLTVHLPSVGRHFYDVPRQNLVNSAAFFALAGSTLVMHVSWWTLAYNYYNHLWNEIFDRLPLEEEDYACDKVQIHEPHVLETGGKEAAVG